MKSPYEILQRPVITEAATLLADQKSGAQYVFEVARGANKIEIRRAVEAVYKVKVKSVNTILVKGKFRRQGRSAGHQPNWKKAFVILEEGQKIEVV